ncbi:MAG: hypothetical protein KDE02_15105, partial [Rhodobacteraceae bacterium]|nr:hypothetical protein [Paracoccaceae bacterium]
MQYECVPVESHHGIEGNQVVVHQRRRKRKKDKHENGYREADSRKDAQPDGTCSQAGVRKSSTGKTANYDQGKGNEDARRECGPGHGAVCSLRPDKVQTQERHRKPHKRGLGRAKSLQRPRQRQKRVRHNVPLKSGMPPREETGLDEIQSQIAVKCGA